MPRNPARHWRPPALRGSFPVMTLPVVLHWYGLRSVDDRTWCLTEPHVHPIFSANIFLVLGRDADLVIDSGMGIAPLRPVLDELRPDPERPLKLFTTHTHVDHIGAAHEFDIRLVHPIEADGLEAPEPYSLSSADIPEAFRTLFLDAGYPPLWPLLIDALPAAGYDPTSYALKSAPATGMLEDGDIVDLGDWQAEVIHMPGHSPGQSVLWQFRRPRFSSERDTTEPASLHEGQGIAPKPMPNDLFRRLKASQDGSSVGEPGIRSDAVTTRSIDRNHRAWKLRRSARTS